MSSEMCIRTHLHFNIHLNMVFPKALYLVPYFYLLYVNGLSKIMSDISNPVLFADGISMIIKNSGLQVFKKDIHRIIVKLNKWLKSNLLS